MKLTSSKTDWANGTLRLPSALMRSFHRRLSENSIPSAFSARLERFGSGHRGGADHETSLAHFAMNFAGGAARSIFVYVDPGQEFDRPSAVLRALTFDGTLSIIDAPCGAGATSLGLLSVVHSLRKKNILPKTPLDVHLHLADVSVTARALAAKTASEMKVDLASVGINMTFHEMDWDAESQDDLALLSAAASGDGMNAALVLVGAFSYALQNELGVNYGQIGSTLSTKSKPCAVVWIEPSPESQKPARRGSRLLGALVKKMRDARRSFGIASAPDDEVLVGACRAFDPIEDTPTPFDVHAAVHVFFNRTWTAK